MHIALLPPVVCRQLGPSHDALPQGYGQKRKTMGGRGCPETLTTAAEGAMRGVTGWEPTACMLTPCGLTNQLASPDVHQKDRK